MKRFLATALAVVALFTATTAFAQSYQADQLTFRDHRGTSAAIGDYGDAGIIDSLVSCGNGTGLVDTTVAWTPSDRLLAAWSGGAVGDSIVRIKVFVTQAVGTLAQSTVADLNAATITVQGSMDGYTWGTVAAATAMSNWQADPQKSGSVPFFFGPTSHLGWKSYRFILTGISATSGCFKLFVVAPVN